MATGLGQYATTFEARLVLTAVVAISAFGAAYVVRRARKALSDRFAPIAIDVAGSIVSIGIVLMAVVGVAELWEQEQILVEQFGLLQLEERAPQIAVTVVVLVAIQVFASVARRLLDDITRESDAMSEHEREISYRVTQLVLWIAGLIVVLGVWEVNLGGLLVGAGFLGIVVGLAARQTLGSLLAGFVLMFSRPFEVGDWIAVGQGQNEDEGVVTDITMMNTRIQAFDGEFVVVPNDVISGRTVRNRSRKGRLRIEVEVGVDYSTDIERARELATDAVSEIDMIMTVPRAEAVVKSFDDSAVTIGVRGWIEHPSSRRRWRATTRMIAAIKECFAEEGIKIPFPQRELSGRQEAGGFRVAQREVGERPVVEEGDPTDRRAEGAATGSDGAGIGSDGAGTEADGAPTEAEGTAGTERGESADTPGEPTAKDGGEVRPDGSEAESTGRSGGDEE